MGPSDGDNDALPTWGHPAAMPDRQAIESLIARYYAAAAAGDGSGACRLTDPLLAESVGEQRGGDLGLPPSSSCGRVLSKLFAQRRRELSEDSRSFAIAIARVKGNRGFAYVRFGVEDNGHGHVRERDIALRRQGGAWRVNAVLDDGSP
jgi:hypothetical protein